MKEPLTRKSVSGNVKMTALSQKPKQVNEPKMVSRVTCDRQQSPLRRAPEHLSSHNENYTRCIYPEHLTGKGGVDQPLIRFDGTGR